jgi:hypothetical protein
MVVHFLTRFTWSNIIHASSRSPPSYICFTKSTPMPGPTSNILNTNTLSESEPWPGNKFSWTYGQLLQPLSMVMPSMTPYLRMYLNEVTSFLMLGELIYLYLSRMGTSSSKVKVFAGAPSGLSSSSPTSSLVASIMIEEFVACGVLSTCSARRVRL